MDTEVNVCIWEFYCVLHKINFFCPTTMSRSECMDTEVNVCIWEFYCVLHKINFFCPTTMSERII